MTFQVVYDYCNLGGVTSVFKHRIAELRRRGDRTPFRFLFRQDLGGRSDLLELDGVTVDICPAGDFRAWAAATVSAGADPVILLDQPEVLARLDAGARRVIYEVHTSLEQTFRRMRGVDFTGVERIVAVSEWLRRKLGEVLPEVPEERHAVLHNFVDPELFRRVAASGAPAFEAPPVVWVGKVAPDKNWEDALEILRLLDRERPVTPVLVTGGLPDPAAVAAFLHRAHAFGFLGRMRWISNLAHAAMPDLLNAARAAGGVLLSTSKFESFGLGVLEAMACGLPVVAARVGGLADVLGDLPGAAFLLGDNERAAAMIGALMEDRRRHLRASRLAEARAARFDRDRIMDAWTALLAPPRKPRRKPRLLAAE